MIGKRVGSAIWMIFSSAVMSQQVTTMSADDIRQTVEQSVKSELNLLAKQQKWGAFDIALVTFVPESVKHLPRCQQPLMINGRDNQSMPIGHLKRSVICQDGVNEWRINTTVRSTLTLPVVVAAKALSRDSEITLADIKLERRELTRDTPFIATLERATGQQVNRRLRTGQMVNSRYVSAPPLVQKGNEVLIIASSGKFSAQTRGVAMETGGKGEQIDVQNSRSKKVIRAVVTGSNQVHTQF
ncbi:MULTISPECIES: flagellar basal body P-ring formation chaperone FlgA [Vibrio]|uniref:Flagella basal body P-ring formation protein FlgA n=1 Tax=Vibrio qingdaonensis TaxID=2829491 RepID=A0A9X3CNE5_9VIBR|nr:MULTISPECIES: flagellar basal body P-ring formation chaperone FlgA [Vibrio]MCL9776531.1 flagellar basal body P-ring formation protein FlgA [Vibrio methylphosphonaticus]MCW8346617.1 flagellar basal body P-ring formation protein FlgA [Vibrio qingdaonensis]